MEVVTKALRKRGWHLTPAAVPDECRTVDEAEEALCELCIEISVGKVAERCDFHVSPPRFIFSVFSWWW